MPNNNWNLIGFALATLAKWQSRHPLASGEQELLSDYTAGAVRSVASPGVLQSLREATRATGHPARVRRARAPVIDGYPYPRLCP